VDYQGHLQDSARDVSAVSKENCALRAEVETLRGQIVALEALVVTDTLTPLANRRGFERRLEFEIRQVERHRIATTLVVIDVNGLKAINDIHGHLAGDMALCHIADHLLRAFRVTDLIARIGGDEFALVLDHAEVADIELRMLRFADNLLAEPVDWLGAPLTLTASWGITDVRENDSVETAFDRADSAMYAVRAAQRSDK
jgi:diguanylate cyclase (GGDEF)-like protein